jgi:PAS domain S-box-containing protein
MSNAPSFLQGGGEMGRRMREYDWETHPLGLPDQWPRSLKTVVRIMLTSRYAMWMGWGPELYFFCNDAYLPTTGVKEAWVLGAPAGQVWAEVWPDISTRIEAVMERGESTWDESLLLFLERSGFAEETYHTFSYSPAPNDDGSVGGLLCVVTEETERVLGERRLSLLRALGLEFAAAATERQLFDGLRRGLEARPQDLPFALVYLFDPEGTRASLACAHGAVAGSEVAPGEILLAGGPGVWPAANIFGGGQTVIVDEIWKRFESLPPGPWPRPPRMAAVVPLAHQSHAGPAGFLVAGINPYRTFDAGYRGFVELLAGQISAALNSARAYEEERMRAEALVELDRVKTAFFSNVSHEFRTPLTLMLSPLEDLVGKPEEGLRPANRRLASLAHRNGLRLLKLVNTLLDFSRLEAGRVEAAYEPLDLAGFTAELASAFRSAVEKAGLEYIVETPPLSQPVYVDREMWEKVVLNLISNAFKFTHRGSIRVSVMEREDHVLTEVSDTGIGIPAEAVPHLFERFYRVQGVHGRTHEGSGIGLAMVHELVKLHAGRVDVHSKPGQGSTFTVYIAKGSAHLPPERIRATRTMESTRTGASPYIDEAVRWLADVDEFALALDSGLGAIGGGEPGPERPTVLLADDNADMRNYLARLLSNRFRVIAVSDGEAALEMARKEKPDLILSDVMMPRLDGFGLLRELRGDRALGSVPVIMLSARAGEEARVHGLDAGADDYLVKPFSARELLARVSGTLAVSRARRDAAEREAQLRAETAELLETMTLAFIALDEDFRYVYMNAEAERVLKVSRDNLLNTCMWERLPGSELTEFGRGLRQARTSQTAVRFETFYDPWGRWFEVNAYPMSGGRLGVFFRDITENRRIEEEMRAARESAEAAKRSKDRFLAVLSHELRTPLSPVLMSVSAMAADPDLPPALSEEMVMIRRNIELETRLIDDLLDISRIANGKLALHTRPVDLNEKIKNVAQICREQILEKAIRLHLSLDDHLGNVMGDASRLQQVLWNVIKNAAKFTPAGGEIHITTLLTTEECAQVVVRDTGIGIAADALPAIFDAFEQGGPEITRQFGGLGLGLAISKVLVEMHGGAIRAESPGVGHGATFVITLPRMRDTPSAAPAEASGGEIAGVRPRRLLIVEDHADTARVLSRLLRKRGYDILIAGTTARAMEIIASEPVEIMLSDVGLPDGTGYELIRRAREIRPLVGIAMSGFGMEEDIARSREAGFLEHLVKPVDAAIIDETIRRLAKF